MRTMTKVLALVSMGLICGAFSAQADTVVLDFEDLPGAYLPIPAGYGGIADWNGWTTFDIPDDNYPPYSGVVRCLLFGNGNPIYFGEPYVFEGVWISGSYNPDWVVWYELYIEGVLVHTSEGVAPSSTPTWNPSGYALPVDEVRIIHTFSNFFCFDDFTYSTTVVPVEETAWGSVKDLFR